MNELAVCIFQQITLSDTMLVKFIYCLTIRLRNKINTLHTKHRYKDKIRLQAGHLPQQLPTKICSVMLGSQNVLCRTLAAYAAYGCRQDRSPSTYMIRLQWCRSFTNQWPSSVRFITRSTAQPRRQGLRHQQAYMQTGCSGAVEFQDFYLLNCACRNHARNNNTAKQLN